MTYAKNLFEGVPKKHANKSRFNLSHEWKAGINMAKIIPFLTEPTMPGDEFEIPSIEFMFRCAPLYYPIMQMASMYCNLFWVPNRILWRTTNFHTDAADGWVNFITLTDNGNQEHPWVEVDNQLKANASENDTVLGYMGIPYWKEAVDWVDTITNVNALPLSAYLAVWDEYYRNPQIEPGKWFNLSPGDNTNGFDADGVFATENTGRYRCFSSKWEKDYFTSALPTPQAGDPVQIPLISDYGTLPGSAQNRPSIWKNIDDGLPTADGSLNIQASGGSAGQTITSNPERPFLDIQESAPDMRELRLAEALQTFKERILKVGQRYTDYIKGLFGNHPTPGSVDVPVWFGYYRGKIQISDVIQTATTDTETTQYKTGQYVGRADLYEKSQSFNIFCAEHGWILGLLEIKPNTVYGQGIPRWFRYQLPTDYPLDIFAGIGDQEILKEEVAFTGFATLASKNQETFGYIPRYSEMRYRNSRWVGNMGNDFGKSQHLGRIWADEVLDSALEYDTIEINEQFINMYSQLTTDQRPQFGGLREADVFTVLPLLNNSTSENTIWAHIYISMFVNRNLPMFSTPKLGV